MKSSSTTARAGNKCWKLREIRRASRDNKQRKVVSCSRRRKDGKRGLLKRRGKARDIAAIPIQINANGPRCQGQKEKDSAHIFSPPCGCNDEHLRHAILRNRETERVCSFRLHEIAPRKISFLTRILHNATQRGQNEISVLHRV